jgi:ABC-type thiamine transport system substrate-binding protein
VLEGAETPDAYKLMARPETLYFDSETVAENRRNWIREWRTSASQ